MRYVLRNKHKIEAELGKDILDRIERSIKQIGDDPDIEHPVSEPFPIIFIDDVDHTVNIIALYIISNVYDVSILAFKDFIG